MRPLGRALATIERIAADNQQKRAETVIEWLEEEK